MLRVISVEVFTVVGVRPVQSIAVAVALLLRCPAIVLRPGPRHGDGSLGALASVCGWVSVTQFGQRVEKRANPLPLLGVVPERAVEVDGVPGAPPGPGAGDVALGLQVGHDRQCGAFGDAPMP